VSAVVAFGLGRRSASPARLELVPLQAHLTQPRDPFFGRRVVESPRTPQVCDERKRL